MDVLIRRDAVLMTKQILDRSLANRANYNSIDLDLCDLDCPDTYKVFKYTVMIVAVTLPMIAILVYQSIYSETWQIRHWSRLCVISYLLLYCAVWL